MAMRFRTRKREKRTSNGTKMKQYKSTSRRLAGGGQKGGDESITTQSQSPQQQPLLQGDHHQQYDGVIDSERGVGTFAGQLSAYITRLISDTIINGVESIGGNIEGGIGETLDKGIEIMNDPEKIEELKKTLRVARLILVELEAPLGELIEEMNIAGREIAVKMGEGAGDTATAIAQAFFAEIPVVGGIIDLAIAGSKAFKATTSVAVESSIQAERVAARVVDFERLVKEAVDRVTSVGDDVARAVATPLLPGLTSGLVKHAIRNKTPHAAPSHHTATPHKSAQHGGDAEFKLFQQLMNNDDFVGLDEPQSGGARNARAQSAHDARINRSSVIRTRIDDFTKLPKYKLD
jgi:hypothetical protein